jgi:hypothetical protein
MRLTYFEANTMPRPVPDLRKFDYQPLYIEAKTNSGPSRVEEEGGRLI